MIDVLVVGSLNMDHTAYVEKRPKAGETVIAKGVGKTLGGKGFNQAVACARGGLKTALVGAIGKDEDGKEFKEALAKEGIIDLLSESEKEPTGFALITVDDKSENSIVVSQGANMDLPFEVIEKAIKEQEPKYLLLQLEISKENVQKSLQLANSLGICTILNPAPYMKLDDETFKYIDFLTPNKVELEALSGNDILSNLPGYEIKNAANALMKKGVKNVLVTVGKMGCCLNSKDRYEYAAGYTVEALDTVGAGDCFNGYFISGLVRGYNLYEAMRFANKAAAISITRRGGSISFPTYQELLPFNPNK